MCKDMFSIVCYFNAGFIILDSLSKLSRGIGSYLGTMPDVSLGLTWALTAKTQFNALLK